MSFFKKLIVVVFLAYSTVQAGLAQNLPAGFIDLKDLDPSIKVNSDAGKEFNFIGRPFKGYSKNNKIIVSRQLGMALREVQKDLKTRGFSLLVYDAYRPQRAVDDFLAWGKDLQDQKMKKWFYPYVDKATVFAAGYVAKKSRHSRGGAVDLTLIPLNKNANKLIISQRKLASGRVIPFLDDGTLDMGSSGGLFDKVSWTNDRSIPLQAQENRKILKEAMEKHGFKNYAKEWWHYNLVNEPFPHTYFNFPVE